MKYYLLLTFLAFLSFSCSDDSTVVEDDMSFEYTQRTSNSFYISSSTKAIDVENPIGFVTVTGGSDTVEVDYILDKTVKVKSSSLSQAAFDKIYLDPNLQEDTVICTVISPANDATSKCHLNLIIPYHKPIIVKNTNGGVSLSNLFSDIYTETNIYDCTVNSHNGSLEAHSTTGNISASINIAKNGNCNCYSESGDILIEIPINSSLNIHMKTDSGTITYTNLNFNITSSSTTELKGSLNSGDGSIYLESKKGNIVLKGI